MQAAKSSCTAVPSVKKRRPLPSVVEHEADDQALLARVVSYYHATLKESPQGQAYLTERGLMHPELIDRFKLGYANSTLTYR